MLVWSLPPNQHQLSSSILPHRGLHSRYSFDASVCPISYLFWVWIILLFDTRFFGHDGQGAPQEDADFAITTTSSTQMHYTNKQEKKTTTVNADCKEENLIEQYQFQRESVEGETDGNVQAQRRIRLRSSITFHANLDCFVHASKHYLHRSNCMHLLPLIVLSNMLEARWVISQIHGCSTLFDNAKLLT